MDHWKFTFVLHCINTAFGVKSIYLKGLFCGDLMGLQKCRNGCPLNLENCINFVLKKIDFTRSYNYVLSLNSIDRYLQCISWLLLAKQGIYLSIFYQSAKRPWEIVAADLSFGNLALALWYPPKYRAFLEKRLCSYWRRSFVVVVNEAAHL